MTEPGLTVEISGKVYRFTWKSLPLDARVYKKIFRQVTASRDYAPLNGSRLAAFYRFVAKVNTKYRLTSSTGGASLDQSISIRNVALKHKIVANQQRLNAALDELTVAYDNGDDILQLSTQYDYAPLSLLRGILLHKGLSAKPATLSGRDLQQYRKAELNDAEQSTNQRLVAEIAAENEASVVSYFVSLGISITTQNQLTAMQIQEHGRAVSTPDILFNDEVYINGTRVYWLDYKDYICTSVKFLASSNRAQAAKYTDRWGHGALCYGAGVVDDASISSATLLDARALPLKLRQGD